MRRARRSEVLVAAAISVLAFPAIAKGETNTFEGTCSMTGQLRFDQPLGTAPISTGFTDRASGTCGGALNGDPLGDARAEIHGKGSGTLSCFAGHSTSAAMLTFTRAPNGVARKTVIRFVTDTSGAGLQFLSEVRGVVSGSGIGEVDFAPYADQPAFDACVAGGLASARYDLSARTVTPIAG
jgi:hypothetical protein